MNTGSCCEVSYTPTRVLSMNSGLCSRRFVLAGLAGLAAQSSLAGDLPIVFAAASLKAVLDDILSGQNVAISYGGSGLLARQISLGAPADLFISANVEWMDAVSGVAIPDTRRDLLSNRLALVGRGSGHLDKLNDTDRIVTGLTDAVPLGQYTKTALQNLGHWERLSPNLIEVENSQLALAYVLRGEVPFGLLYSSDIVGQDDLKVLQVLPETSHPPIRYPMVLLSERARSIYEMLLSERARRLFNAYGFGVI